MPYGKLWKMHRKLLQSTLSNSSVRQWQPFQAQEARRTIARMMQHPDGWETSLRRFTVAIVLKVSYGVDVVNDDDAYIKIAEDAMAATGNGGAPANSIVDAVPFGEFRPCGSRPAHCNSRSTFSAKLVTARLAAPLCPRVEMGNSAPPQCAL